MEIYADIAKRTVLLLLQDGDDAQPFCDHLAQDFIVVRSDTVEECLLVMDERYADLSAVIVDVDIAAADDCAFLKAASSKERFATIPVLLAAARPLTDADERCLEEGAIDFIVPPYHHGTVRQRVENAIRLKSSTTFFEIERLLRELPVTIYLKDAEGRYVFATHYWDLLGENDPNWTISGKTDLDVRKDRENAIMAMEADAKIIRTGKGTSYVIETNENNKQHFIELTKQPVLDAEGKVTGIVALVKDVTEQVLIRNELEMRLLTDELTGLGSRRAYDEYIDRIAKGEVTFPLAVISADCDRLKAMNDSYGHLVGDEYLRMSALIVKASLPEEARAFRMGGDEFLAFVPGMSQEEADRLIAEMREHQERLKLEETSISISLGAAVLESAADDLVAAIERADRAMYADKASRKQLR